MSADAFERLCDHARELDDEALGWFSRRLPWGSYGMLARASLSAPTLSLALKRWCWHHGLLADDVMLHLSEYEGTAWLAIKERRDLGDLREFCLVSPLRNALGLFSWMVDARIVPDEAHFPYPAPAHAADYAVLFTEALHFEAGRAAVAFDARYLALSARMLHRRLREESTSWQAIKDAVRRERALRLVPRGEKPLKQTAAAVGFCNEKSFSRVFRQ